MGRPLHAELEMQGSHPGWGWEVEVDEAPQTEVSPIHFQEGAPLLERLGKKTKPLITIRNVHAISHLVCGIGSSRESRGKCGRWAGLGAPLPTGGGKRGSGLAQEAGLSEGWWAHPLHCAHPL